MNTNNNTVAPINQPNHINVLPGDGAWIDASQMAKPFGKKPAAWLRTQAAKQYLQQLSSYKNLPLTELVKHAKQGNQKSTWLHQDAALEFARWLSPAFAIWSNGHTRQQLLSAALERQPSATQLPGTESELQTTVQQLQLTVHNEARKMSYIDGVLQSRTLIPTTVIAKELGLSAIALNKLLHEKEVIYKTGDHWVLYAQYQGQGYTGTKTALYLDSQGRYQSHIHTYWTEQGRAFIHELLKTDQQQVA